MIRGFERTTRLPCGTRRVIGRLRSAGRDARVARRGGRRGQRGARAARALGPAGAATPDARAFRAVQIFSTLRRRAVKTGVADGGAADGVPRACARTRDRCDATRGDAKRGRCEHAPPRYSVVCDAAHRARAKWTARGVRFENVSWRAREPVETVDPRFFCETASPYDFVFSRHTMLLVLFFSAFFRKETRTSSPSAPPLSPLAAQAHASRPSLLRPRFPPSSRGRHAKKKKARTPRIIPRGSCAGTPA